MAMNSRRILIACGGSGGHLAPGIALAQELSGRGHQPVLFVSSKAVDRRILAPYSSWPVFFLPASPPSKKLGAFLRFAYLQLLSLVQTLRFLNQNPAAAVVVTGGFTSPPVALAGFLKKIPLFIHESNRVPGKVTRHLARLARRVYLPSEWAVPQISKSQRHKFRPLGYPLRSEFFGPEALAQEGFPKNPEKGLSFLLLGGSQGAWALNRWFREHVEELAPLAGRWVCVTGEGYYEAHGEDLEKIRQNHPSVEFLPFCEHMPSLLAEADLVIARAGAGSIAECLHCEAPMLLVPLPSASEGHQQANAEWARALGCAYVVRQENLDFLLPLLRWLHTATGILRFMRHKSRDRAQADVRRLIVDDMEASLDGT
ncbi:MAG: UDP-N-acetylglucosamine--N-acetylmuramyl-(pentapeptide) pyrophosphoryl-undecaprenol N-acetylglucosamine transferase [Puniceicoccales bacterium]|jgi:UDP-N-acetylglucosamine--N-acetylmuramyl-(pentapeptide) pyrophosphoryl-undecaprenol N-acetylglucosamine transferase|nr:UDP-N-acetylglucosamine--N-acetylmuramyl-(pentapeptide) pyrophosphoryl-undecaprenol N-acetylglucosamine transferase [Puniceicoccales bacterium]